MSGPVETAAMALAGGIGALARVEIGRWLTRHLGSQWADRWGIRTMNVLGAVALALLVTAGAPPTSLQILGTGLLGGFTTFSTWMVQADPQNGPAASATEVVVPLGLALLAVMLIKMAQ